MASLPEPIPWRRRAGPLLAGLLVGLSLASSAHPEGPQRDVHVGVVATGRGATVDALLSGLRSGLDTAHLRPEVLEKTLGDDASLARATVEEFAFEGVDVLFAVGPRAATLARDALRDRSVVFLGVGYPEAHGLPGRGNVCGVASGVAAREIVGLVRRVAPDARVLGVLIGAGGDDAHVRDELVRAAIDDGLELRRLAEPDPDLAGCDAVFLAPGVDDRHAAGVARRLAGSRTALLGSRRAHLDAGCSVALFRAPEEVGRHAAALCMRLLRGEVPEQLGVRRLHRRRLEINLDAARRLHHEIPLPVLASADRLTPPLGRRR